MKQRQRLKAAQKRWYDLGWVRPGHPWTNTRHGRPTKRHYRLPPTYYKQGEAKTHERFSAVMYHAVCRECDGHGGYYGQDQFGQYGGHACPACDGAGYSKKAFRFTRG